MQPCVKNQFCPPGTKGSISLKCPAGTYNTITNAKSLDDCIACPYGKYCLSGEDPVDCPMGYYCPKSTEYATQYPCPAGYYLNSVGSKVLGECRPCSLGNYCPSVGQSAKTPCPVGMYNDFSNTADACLTCDAGRYCPTLGTIYQQKCIPGKYSDAGAGKCTYCEVGTYCPNEATTKSEKDA